MREKLIELLYHSGDECDQLCRTPQKGCHVCKYADCGAKCINVMEADYLIANGVTIKDNGLIPTALGFYPEKGGDYLCLCCIDGHTEYPFYMVLRYYIVDKNPHFQHESEHGLKVTHWMCLPDMPKDGDT